MTVLKPNWSVSFKFNPHDLWVGVYWDRVCFPAVRLHVQAITFYVCPLPCLCIKVQRSLLNDKYVVRRGKHYLKKGK